MNIKEKCRYWTVDILKRFQQAGAAVLKDLSPKVKNGRAEYVSIECIDLVGIIPGTTPIDDKGGMNEYRS